MNHKTSPLNPSQISRLQIAALLFAIIITISVGILIFLLLPIQSAPQSVLSPTTTTDANGSQVLTIHAKGGYAPHRLTAKARTPTTLKIVTNGTYDCSSALRIPTLDYSVHLPVTWETSIDVPLQEAGTILTGFCSMGMYSFKVVFE